MGLDELELFVYLSISACFDKTAPVGSLTVPLPTACQFLECTSPYLYGGADAVASHKPGSPLNWVFLPRLNSDSLLLLANIFVVPVLSGV